MNSTKMKINTKFILIIFFIPKLIFAQHGLWKFNLKKEIIVNQRIKSITVSNKTLEYSEGDEYTTMKFSYDEIGGLISSEEKFYYDDQLRSQTNNIWTVEYENGLVSKKKNEEFYLLKINDIEYLYKDEKLVSSVDHWAMNERKTRVYYEYDQNDRLIKKKKRYKFTSIEEFEYQNDTIKQINFFRYESDTLPHLSTYFYYYYNGNSTIKEVKEITIKSFDPALLKQFNDKEQPVYSEPDTSSVYSNDIHFYQVWKKYNDQGLLIQKEYGESYGKSLIEKYDHKISYKYNDKVLIQKDSSGILSTYTYTDFGKVLKELQTFKNSVRIYDYSSETYVTFKKGDTASLITYVYDSDLKLKEIFTENRFDVQETYKEVFSYNFDGKLILEEVFKFGKNEECIESYNYLDDGKKIIQTTFCPLNDRNLPANVPYDIIEKTYDERGKLISLYEKSGDHDSSIHITSIDSFYYKNNKLYHQTHTPIYKNVGPIYKIDGYSRIEYGYDGDNRLYRYVIKNRDTLASEFFFYSNGRLIKSTFSNEIEKIETTYNQEGYILKRTRYNKKRETSVNETWIYKNGLPIQYNSMKIKYEFY